MIYNTYDLRNFYTQSTDTKGHLTTLRVNLPPSMLHEMGNFVAARKIPQYRSNADIARDAIFHRLHWITEEYHADEFVQPLTMWAIRQRIEQTQEAEKAAESVLGYVHDHLLDPGTADIIKDTLSAVDLPVHLRSRFESALMRIELQV